MHARSVMRSTAPAYARPSACSRTGPPPSAAARLRSSRPPTYGQAACSNITINKDRRRTTMPRRGQTVTEFFREEQSCVPSLDADLIALLEHLQNAFKLIGAITAQGALDSH